MPAWVDAHPIASAAVPVAYVMVDEVPVVLLRIRNAEDSESHSTAAVVVVIASDDTVCDTLTV